MPAIEESVLFRRMQASIEDLAAGPDTLWASFLLFKDRVEQESKYIINVFPEYTPHDPPRHLANLFHIADRVLGEALYDRLNAAELLTFGFALFGHDWGMAIGEAERRALEGDGPIDGLHLIRGEPATYRKQLAETELTRQDFFTDYCRRTHGDRSAARIQRALGDVSSPLASVVARVAAGHTYPQRRLRDAQEFPLSEAVLGHTVNVCAMAEYVRIVDLLDLGEDRTPFALWKFVAPRNSISSGEWRKHRALSPVSVESVGAARRVVVSGVADSPLILARLQDLESWVQEEFGDAIALLRTMPERYHLDLDSRLAWSVQAIGFEPVRLRFELQRESLLSALAGELYGGTGYAFVRELLQNSIDAIDTRMAMLAAYGTRLEGGRIDVVLRESGDRVDVTWRDNGIGMDLNVLSGFFAKIGSSWYQSHEFRKLNLGLDPISRFGVGILSCFSVAETMRLTTRRDPAATVEASGLSVEIVSRDAHFRVERIKDVPIGTSISMAVATKNQPRAFMEAFARALEDCAAYCGHEVTISTGDGLPRLVPSYARMAEGGGTQHAALSGSLVLRGKTDAETKLLLETLEAQTFRIGGGASDFEGFYSCALPRSLSQVASVGHRRWQVGRADISTETPELTGMGEFYIRGVRIAGHSEHSRGQWLGPRMVVNFKRPSLLPPSLDRTRVRTEQALGPVWREVGSKLRGLHALSVPEDLSARADVLGAVLELAGLPAALLDSFLDPAEWPCAVLKPGQGFVWAKLGDWMSRAEVVVAPFQLGYCLPQEIKAIPVNLPTWQGPECAVSFWHTGSGPIWRAAGSASWKYLEARGFAPTELHFLRGSDDDSVPLPIEVRRAKREDRDAELERANRAVKGVLLDYAPAVVAFGAPFGNHAFCGSKYWNFNNAKVRRVAEALERLGEKLQSHELPEALEREIRFRTSTGALDYILPSRITKKPLGLDTLRILLSTCSKVGIGGEELLGEEDFVPGTLGGYENPYGYRWRQWSESKCLGTDWGSGIA